MTNIAFSRLLALMMLACPIITFAEGQESSSGEPVFLDPIPGEKFNYECRLYAVKDESVAAVSMALPFNNRQYDLKAVKWEKFGEPAGEAGEFSLREAKVTPFPTNKNNIVTLVKREKTSNTFLLINVLDDSKRPAVAYSTLFPVNLSAPKIQAELRQSGAYESFTFGISCERK